MILWKVYGGFKGQILLLEPEPQITFLHIRNLSIFETIWKYFWYCKTLFRNI